MYWVNNLCRICAQVGDLCFPIFDKENNHDLEIKIKKCLSIEVSADDFKPKEICNTCVLKLNDFYDLMNLCHASNYKFESLLYTTLQNKAEKAEQYFNTSVFSETQNFSKPSNEDITTNLQIKDGLLDGIMNNQQNSSCRYALSNGFCNSHLPANNVDYNSGNQLYSSLTENPGVLRHSVNCNNVNNSLVTMSCFDSEKLKDARQNNSLKINTCDVNLGLCNVNTNDEFKMSGPVFQESSSIPVLVNESASTNTKNSEQKLKNSSEKLNIICVQTIKFAVNNTNDDQKSIQQSKTKCNLEGTGPENKNPVHYESSGPIKPCFLCVKCNKSFKRKITLKAHLAKHTNYRPFVCQICQKKFAVQWDLTLHSRVHTSQFQCKYCSKNFTVPSKLERHIRIHTNNRPFVCDFTNCGRKFSDKRNLEGHKSMHTDVKNYSCQICQKSYKTKKHLREHEIRHKEKLPFKCSTCDKEYKWKTNLLQHMKKHTGYKCVNCNKNISKLSVLIKHRKECQKQKESSNT